MWYLLCKQQEQQPSLPSLLSSHRAQLSRLAESDTDFHDFLKKNDPDLLTFDLSEDEAVDCSDLGDKNDSTGDESDSTDDENDSTDDESDVDVIETPPSSVTSYPEVGQ